MFLSAPLVPGVEDAVVAAGAEEAAEAEEEADTGAELFFTDFLSHVIYHQLFKSRNLPPIHF